MLEVVRGERRAEAPRAQRQLEVPDRREDAAVERRVVRVLAARTPRQARDHEHRYPLDDVDQVPSGREGARHRWQLRRFPRGLLVRVEVRLADLPEQRADLCFQTLVADDQPPPRLGVTG